MTGAGTPTFGDRLNDAFGRFGRLSVGIDPHPYLLSAWGLSDDAAGLREFGLRVVEASAGQAGIVKPQVAFFERHGSRGYAALEEVIAAARAAGLLVIADAKRGDVGTSVEAYGETWLRPGSPLEADAVTLVAYQGVGSLDAPIRLAREHGKGVFVLAATSNPEGRDIQRAFVDTHAASAAEDSNGTSDGGAPRRVARAIVDDIVASNAAAGETKLGSVGVVIGATLRLAEFQLDFRPSPVLPVLAPGFGHQGAAVSQSADIFGPMSPGVIVAQSRSVLDAGPTGIAAAIKNQAKDVRSNIA
ncbi:orotidine-5'-phosphate decarboxylase [Leifsonia sp. ALI-44-B]|uniref:orotidine-5'-phosphate decarboxylase n=1 Tax=Leifsonia sp. ALI-44-B TaxID=1933776 RepID=UPI00097CB442|nr:orotidine-5'-phosphate decarboxylase [Leifsonia sp. ALI-44-B]ONI63630.1 orotidine-5'-phosphate decarboxylase [Leifsonia sp. ALI-44-B]